MDFYQIILDLLDKSASLESRVSTVILFLLVFGYMLRCAMYIFKKIVDATKNTWDDNLYNKIQSSLLYNLFTKTIDYATVLFIKLRIRRKK
jgi:ABC-type spermidine/putrescine transport system permease subunit I